MSHMDDEMNPSDAGTWILWYSQVNTMSADALAPDSI